MYTYLWQPLPIGCNNGGGGGNFSKVKRLVTKCGNHYSVNWTVDKTWQDKMWHAMIRREQGGTQPPPVGWNVDRIHTHTHTQNLTGHRTLFKKKKKKICCVKRVYLSIFGNPILVMKGSHAGVLLIYIYMRYVRICIRIYVYIYMYVHI